MASWITDGSTGFTINENAVTFSSDEGGSDVFNCMWKEGDGVSDGSHYWKIHFDALEEGAAVGLTSVDHFKKGYACRGLGYLGNLSDGACLLIGNFGPSPSAGDVIGILSVFESDRLKVYIDVNGSCLGLAFDVPSSMFKSVFPYISFHKSGTATCSKETNIPNAADRASNNFSGIEGDWKLTNFVENGITLELKCPLTTKLRQVEANKYSWSAKIVNNVNTRLTREDDVWKTGPAMSTKKLGPPDFMKLESTMISLMEGLKIIEIDANEQLSIQSDTISSLWTRYDASPAPYVGQPFQ